MRKTTVLLASGVLMAGAVVGYYFWQSQPMTEPQMMQPLESAAPQARVEDQTHFPLPAVQDTEAAAKPLPMLNDSDAEVWHGMSDLFGKGAPEKFFLPQSIVRHIVVTVDNLPRKMVATRLLPTQPVNGAFLAERQGDGTVISQANAARYAPYVRLAEMVNSKQLVAWYVHFYPLFQQAYEDLGYPNAYFNDRLVEVIDHMLSAPEVEGQVALVQPHVLYKFADPALEDSSAGHKIMLRMGSENAERVKAKLREIRNELTKKDAAQQAAR